jgi:hypothetical protein
MRHYEILANGCIPWFVGLQDVPSNRLTHFPKELVLEAKQGFESYRYKKNEFNLKWKIH